MENCYKVHRNLGGKLPNLFQSTTTCPYFGMLSCRRRFVEVNCLVCMIALWSKRFTKVGLQIICIFPSVCKR